MLNIWSALTGALTSYLKERALSAFQQKVATPQFILEREMPGLGKLSGAELKVASQGSCSIPHDLGPDIKWVHSYVIDDKIYCVYRASTEELIQKHAIQAGFPANSVAKVRATINPTTAE